MVLGVKFLIQPVFLEQRDWRPRHDQPRMLLRHLPSNDSCNVNDLETGQPRFSKLS